MPLVLSVSALLPASIHTPTVDVCAHGECSVAIYAPLGLIQIEPHNTYSKSVIKSGTFGIYGLVHGCCKAPRDGLD